MDTAYRGIMAEASQIAASLPLYGLRCLKILDKGGTLLPLVLNRAQRMLHERLEEQLFEQNQVRALVLKGRQQGVSTYVGARFYKRTSLSRGIRTYILTHLAEATDNLFGMVERFHNNVPGPIFKPTTDYNNRKELRFPVLDGGYKVGTAGTKGGGRSATVNCFHGSEVAYWENAQDVVAGALQTVARGNGSEVILESTANGVGGYFHQQWQMALKGIGDYIAVFIPWYWQDEYAAVAPDDWAPTGEEAERCEFYRLTREQAYWMYLKNIEFGGQIGTICGKFMQEYPCNAAEAFQATGENSLIPPQLVMRARNVKVLNPQGARVMGVDPARYGKDRTSMLDRRGRRVWNMKSYTKKNTLQVALLVLQRIEAAEKEGDPYDAVFIDVNGIGAGVVDNLHGWGRDDIVIGINAGEAAIEPERFMNRRAEMWWNVKEWLETPSGVELPEDCDALHADLIAPTYTYTPARMQLVLESKEAMKKRGIDSPDDGDALSHTFYAPVVPRIGRRPQRRAPQDWRAA